MVVEIVLAAQALRKIKESLVHILLLETKTEHLDSTDA